MEIKTKEGKQIKVRINPFISFGDPRYKRAKYVLNHDKFIKVENEELTDVYKIINLYDDDNFIVIRVTIYDDYDAMITTSHLSMDRISEDLVGFDSEDYKYVIENDDKNFNEHLNKALNILIK